MLIGQSWYLNIRTCALPGCKNLEKCCTVDFHSIGTFERCACAFCVLHVFGWLARNIRIVDTVTCASGSMLSTEPGGKAPYAADLRTGMELSYRTVAANLNIALVLCIISTNGLWRLEMCTKKWLHNGHTSGHSDKLLILGLIIDSPSRYLSEVCHAFEDRCMWKVPFFICCM